MSAANHGFGVHLVLDLAECDNARLADLDGVFRLLDGLPAALGMTRVAPPYVFRYSGKVPEDRGITGFVIIAESHISIHTFEIKGYAFADVFSCKAFDADAAEQIIAAALGCRRVIRSSTLRGRDFPRSHAGGGA
jgi:S-adenosylmethionine decarboxylase